MFCFPDLHVSKNHPFLMIITVLCNDLYVRYKWGNNYEDLRAISTLSMSGVERDDLPSDVEEEGFLINLVRHSDTRFANSCRRVSQNVHKNLGNIGAQLEGQILADLNNKHGGVQRDQSLRKAGEEATAMKGRLWNWKTILELSAIADVYEQFGA